MGIASIFLLSSCTERITSPAASFPETTETVMTIPGKHEPVNVNFLPPYDHVESILVKTVTGAQFMISNGENGPLYDEIIWGPYKDPSKTFSDAFKRWGPFEGPDSPVYIARTGTKVFAVVGGIPEASFDSIDRYTAIPLNDGTVAYVGMRGKKAYVSVRGKEYGPYDSVEQNNDLMISPDGRRTAFIARRGTKYTVVVDGIESDWYSLVSTPLFTPDSKQIAFLASRTPAPPQGVPTFTYKELLVIDGKETASRDMEADNAPLWRPDICKSGTHEYMFVPPTFDCAAISRAKFSRVEIVDYYIPDTPVMVASSKDGKVTASVSGVDEFTIDHGSGSTSTDFKKWQAIINGVPGPLHDYVWMPVLSADENTVIYGAYDAAKKAYLRISVKVR